MNLWLWSLICQVVIFNLQSETTNKIHCVTSNYSYFRIPQKLLAITKSSSSLEYISSSEEKLVAKIRKNLFQVSRRQEFVIKLTHHQIIHF